MEVWLPESGQPDGVAHEYEVAPGTGEILYVCDVPEQTEAFPEIAPGCAGVVQASSVDVSKFSLLKSPSSLFVLAARSVPTHAVFRYTLKS